MTGDFHIKNTAPKQNFRNTLGAAQQKFLSENPNQNAYCISLTGTFAKNGKLKPDSEVAYMRFKKTYGYDKIISVDDNKNVVQENMKFGKIDCRFGDISKILPSVIFVEEKEVGFVGLDFLRGPEKELPIINKVLRILNAQDKRCVVFLNLCVCRRRKGGAKEGDRDILGRLRKSEEFRKLIKQGKWYGGLKPIKEFNLPTESNKSLFISLALVKNYKP